MKQTCNCLGNIFKILGTAIIIFGIIGFIYVMSSLFGMFADMIVFRKYINESMYQDPFVLYTVYPCYGLILLAGVYLAILLIFETIHCVTNIYRNENTRLIETEHLY